MDSKTLNLILIGLGAIIALKVISAAKVIPDALASVGEWVGSGLYDFFHPGTFEALYYTVRFPDGKFRAVPSKTVGSNGRFKFTDGITYQMIVEKDRPTGPNKYAVKV